MMRPPTLPVEDRNSPNAAPVTNVHA